MLLFLACGPEIPPGSLATSPYVWPEWTDTCGVTADCAPDAFCHEGACLGAEARTFQFTFVEAKVGSLKPNGDEWETSVWNNTVEPDLMAAVSWTDETTTYEDYGVWHGQECTTSEIEDAYWVGWDQDCTASPTPQEASFGLAPDGYLGQAIRIALYDVDSFDRDFAYDWVWAERDDLDDLAAQDGQLIRLEIPDDHGEAWMDVELRVEVTP